MKDIEINKVILFANNAIILGFLISLNYIIFLSLTCNGGSHYNCLSCSEENFRKLISNECKCIDGYYEIYN